MAAAHLSTQRRGKGFQSFTADGIAIIVADSFSSKLAAYIATNYTVNVFL